jgi:hypothetical protein
LGELTHVVVEDLGYGWFIEAKVLPGETPEEAKDRYERMMAGRRITQFMTKSALDWVGEDRDDETVTSR